MNRFLCVSLSLALSIGCSSRRENNDNINTQNVPIDEDALKDFLIKAITARKKGDQDVYLKMFDSRILEAVNRKTYFDFFQKGLDWNFELHRLWKGSIDNLEIKYRILCSDSFYMTRKIGEIVGDPINVIEAQYSISVIHPEKGPMDVNERLWCILTDNLYLVTLPMKDLDEEIIEYLEQDEEKKPSRWTVLD